MRAEQREQRDAQLRAAYAQERAEKWRQEQRWRREQEDELRREVAESERRREEEQLQRQREEAQAEEQRRQEAYVLQRHAMDALPAAPCALGREQPPPSDAAASSAWASSAWGPTVQTAFARGGEVGEMACTAAAAEQLHRHSVPLPSDWFRVPAPPIPPPSDPWRAALDGWAVPSAWAATSRPASSDGTTALSPLPAEPSAACTHAHIDPHMAVSHYGWMATVDDRLHPPPPLVDGSPLLGVAGPSSSAGCLEPGPPAVGLAHTTVGGRCYDATAHIAWPYHQLPLRGEHDEQVSRKPPPHRGQLGLGHEEEPLARREKAPADRTVSPLARRRPSRAERILKHSELGSRKANGLERPTNPRVGFGTNVRFATHLTGEETARLARHAELPAPRAATSHLYPSSCTPRPGADSGRPFGRAQPNTAMARAARNHIAGSGVFV